MKITMNKIRAILEFILQEGKMNIYRRILRTALWGSFVTSTMLRSQLVGRLFKNCSLQVELLAEKMTNILRHRENHVMKELPVANYTIVGNRVPYLFYTSELTARGISPELRQEISYASSIDDDLERVARRYQGSAVVASKNGYMIRVDMIENNAKGAIFCYEPLRSSYDYKTKEWYQYTIIENKLVFTEPYLASYGKMCISVCAPYYDEQGIAGVIVTDIDTEYIADRMERANVNDSEFSFVMDKGGKIIISPRREGAFSAANMKTNLLEAEDKSLSETAECMIAGKTGIAPVKADGDEYYLAYAPLSDIGWSIGTVVDKSVILESGDKIEAYVVTLFLQYREERNKFLIFAIGVVMIFFVITLYPILQVNIKMAKGFATPINLLTEGVQEISAGNLQKKTFCQN